MKVIMLNGPPRSGKDTMARAIYDVVGCHKMVDIRAISTKIKDASSQLYAYLGGCTKRQAFEDTKDEHNDFFLGRTPRDTWIDLAEWVRQRHGAAWWAQQLANSYRARRDTVLIVTDVGSAVQAMAFCRLGRPLVIEVERAGLGGWDNRRPILPDPTRWDHLTYQSTTEIGRIRYWVRKCILEWALEE